MQITKLITASLILSQSLIYSFAQPANAQLSCQGTVDNVVNQIRSKGVSQVKVRVFQGIANNYYRGNPSNRQDVLSIAMTGGSYDAVESILNSEQLMKAWANSIISACGGTAVVNFGLDGTDWTMEYAVQSDGTTQLRSCTNNMNRDSLAWNEKICGDYGVSDFPIAPGTVVGQLDYLRFEMLPDYELEQTLQEHHQGYIRSSPNREVKYAYTKVDLNSDGKLDALVTFNAPFSYGTGGQHIWIYERTNNGYRSAGVAVHTVTPFLVVTNNKTSGWNDLVTVHSGGSGYRDISYGIYRFNGQEYEGRGGFNNRRTLSGKVIFGFGLPDYIWAGSL